MPYEDRAFVYETPLLDLSRVVQAAFVAEMLIAFGRLAPGPGVRLPPRHRWPLRWWNATLVTFVTFRSGHGDLSARALLLSPGAARTPRGDVLYLDKLWSAQPRRGAGRTLMNALAMVAGAQGAEMRWRTRDPGFYVRWAGSHRAWPPAPAPPLACLHDRDYVHMGLRRRRRAWEAEDVLWLRMPSAWAELL